MMPLVTDISTARSAGRNRTESRILRGGDEPDPRFTLANERTFLAWIRTALAFLAGGIALEAFAADVFPEVVRLAAVLGLLGCAAVVALLAGFRWLRVERALRHKQPLPLSPVAPVVAGVGALAALSLLLALLWQTLRL